MRGETITMQYAGYTIEGVRHPDPDDVIRQTCAIWCDGPPLISMAYRRNAEGFYEFEDSRAQRLYEHLILADALAILRENGVD